MQHKYWVTKQQVCKKLGKKDDEFVVASDAELDAKLELFKSIRGSCQNLQRTVNKYDEKIYSECGGNGRRGCVSWPARSGVGMEGVWG